MNDSEFANSIIIWDYCTRLFIGVVAVVAIAVCFAWDRIGDMIRNRRDK